MRREVAAREKEVASMRVEQDNTPGSRRSNITSKGPTNPSPRVPGRYAICDVDCMEIQPLGTFLFASQRS